MTCLLQKVFLDVDFFDAKSCACIDALSAKTKFLYIDVFTAKSYVNRHIYCNKRVAQELYFVPYFSPGKN